MNIKDFAELYGVSSQAVYQRINRAGLNIKKLKDSDTGELSEAGQEAIKQLFSQHSQVSVDELKDEINTLQKELASLKSENEALKARVHELETERDWLRGQQSELLSRIPAALPAPGQTAQTEKRGLLARIFGR